jgi:hypothetical protein
VLATFVVLAFPASGSALSAVFIQLTPRPSPAVLTFQLGLYPAWQNPDTVAHTVTFADGVCSLQVEPGGYGECSIDFQAGRYSYTVDGTTQASITFVLAGRSVTLRARSHTIRRGSPLRLHGLLDYDTGGNPPVGFTDVPVAVLARHDRHHPFRQIATAATGEKGTGGWPWWLDLRPKRTPSTSPR